MTLDDAKQISAGDKLMTPHSPTPYEALNVTDVRPSESGRVVFVRLRCIAASAQMAGGWFDATAFAFAPRGHRWDRVTMRYVKTKKAKDGSVDIVSVVTREQCRDQWRADREKVEERAA